MRPTPFAKLDPEELGTRLTSELLLAGEGWTPRTVVTDIVNAWTRLETADLEGALGTTLSRSFPRLTGHQIYRALRAADVRETRHRGIWGFVLRPRDHGVGGQSFDRWLMAHVQDGGPNWQFTPQAALYKSYRRSLENHEYLMPMAQFIDAMEGRGFVHVRRWTLVEDEFGHTRRDKHLWGFKELGLLGANDPAE